MTHLKDVVMAMLLREALMDELNLLREIVQSTL